jgi:hypothetical protein
MNEVTEFSQQHLGEQILDAFILDEERMLQLFDRDNDYLSSWTKDVKLKYVHNWKEDKTTAGIISPVPIEVKEEDGA